MTISRLRPGVRPHKRMPGNPKTSKWRSPSNALRKRKVYAITLSDEANTKLDALAADGGRSAVVEALVLGATLPRQ